MQRANPGLLRVAIALPLAFEAYRLVKLVSRAHVRGVDLLVAHFLWLLPAVILAAGAVLVLIEPRGRRLWYAVGAAGSWLIAVDFRTWHDIIVPSWRPSVESAIGLYAALLAAAFLLGHAPRSTRIPDSERPGTGETTRP